MQPPKTSPPRTLTNPAGSRLPELSPRTSAGGHDTNVMKFEQQRHSLLPPFGIESQMKEQQVHGNTERIIQRKNRRHSGNGQMFIAIIHLLLAFGLIDVGMFMSIRFNHIGKIWPDNYRKLSVSTNRWFQNQVTSIRALYSPVAIGIGLMVFLPKIVFLLQEFFSKVSFWRTAVVDACIGMISLFYASITGFHAKILLDYIGELNFGDESNVVCYVIRGARDKASQEFWNRCLIVALKIFGEHLSLLSVISGLVSVICMINTAYALNRQLQQREKKPLNQQVLNQ